MKFVTKMHIWTVKGYNSSVKVHKSGSSHLIPNLQWTPAPAHAGRVSTRTHRGHQDDSLECVAVLINAIPLPIPQDNADETFIPVLKPPPSNSEEGDEGHKPENLSPAEEDDATEYPILKPDRPQNGDDDEYEEFGIARPRPHDSSEEDYEEEYNPVPRPRPEGEELDDKESAEILYPGFRVKRAAGDEDDEDFEYEYGEESNLNDEDDGPVPRPYPEVDEVDDEENAEVVYPGFKVKRSPDESAIEEDENYVHEDENDTVVIDAADCPTLLKECKETEDYFTCQAYRENCPDDDGESFPDEQMDELIFCEEAVKNGISHPKCPELAKD